MACKTPLSATYHDDIVPQDPEPTPQNRPDLSWVLSYYAPKHYHFATPQPPSTLAQHSRGLRVGEPGELAQPTGTNRRQSEDQDVCITRLVGEIWPGTVDCAACVNDARADRNWTNHGTIGINFDALQRVHVTTRSLMWKYISKM
jgi:hypothetical protein